MPPTLAAESVRRFTERLDVAIGYHDELLLAVHGKRRQAGLETTLAEQFVFNAAVLWEVFLNELLLSYLVMSPEHFTSGLKTRLSASIKDRFGMEAARRTRIDLPNRITSRQASALADPKNYNITVGSAAQLATRANDLLVAAHARPFTLSAENAQLFDLVLAIRNYLGHRSDASRAELKRAVAGLNGVNAGLNAPAANVGTYLKTRNAAGEPRSITIGRRLIDVARALV